MKVRARFFTAPTFAVLVMAGLVSLAPPAVAAGPTVTFEAFGPARATTIDLDPSTSRIYDAALPFSRTVTIAPGTTLLQVVVVGSTDVNPGCRIKVNGKVLAEKPVGDDAHCVADISGMSFDDTPPPPAQAKGITYEVKGPGTALTINIEPGGIRLENVPLPFTKTVPDSPGELLEVIGVPTSGQTANPGCRITVDGVVLADKPNGSDGLCVVTQ
jgi:Mycobacterium membrane protein